MTNTLDASIVAGRMNRLRKFCGQLALFVAGLLASATAIAQTAGLQTDGLLFDTSKTIGFPMPLAWKFAEQKSEPITDKLYDACIALAFIARTIEYGNIGVDVWILNGSSASNRLQALYERDGKLAKGHAHEGKYELSLEPCVHAVYPLASDPAFYHLLVHRRANGRAMTVAFTVPKKVLPVVRPMLIALANKVVCKAPLWPPRAEGYEYQQESGIDLAFAPEVKTKARKAMRKMVKAIVKDFTKRHSEPVVLKDEPLVIYVDGDRSKKGTLVEKYDEQIDIFVQHGMRRIVVPILDNNISLERQESAGVIYRYLLRTIYPERVKWLVFGEEGLGMMKVQCGKPLPYAPDSWYWLMKRMRFSFDDVIANNGQVHCGDAAAWIAFLRLSPTKTREAYDTFLIELRTGIDSEAAVSKLLEAVGETKARADAREVLDKKLKTVKRT